MEGFLKQGQSTTPAPGHYTPIVAIRDIIQKPLNYDKYRDLENELNQENLIDFIGNIANKYRDELNGNVSVRLDYLLLNIFDILMESLFNKIKSHSFDIIASNLESRAQNSRGHLGRS
jgi:hypothetical protein